MVMLLRVVIVKFNQKTTAIFDFSITILFSLLFPVPVFCALLFDLSIKKVFIDSKWLSVFVGSFSIDESESLVLLTLSLFFDVNYLKRTNNKSYVF